MDFHDGMQCWMMTRLQEGVHSFVPHYIVAAPMQLMTHQSTIITLMIISP